MSDNVLKAMVDAIAEEDNELGGQLITRFRSAHKWGRNDAYLETANNTRISVPSGTGWFNTAGAVAGDEYDIVSGSQRGRYTVLTVDASGDFITVEILGGGAPGFTDETPVQIRVATLKVESTYEFPAAGTLWAGFQESKVTYGATQVVVNDMEFQQLGDPDTGVGYLTEDHRAELEIIDASRSYSLLDQLRRALLVDYAAGEDLDRVGRNLAVVRQRGMSDTTYRALIKVLSYLPRGTLYALELVLEAFYPGGGYTNENIPYPAPTNVWLIYEDLGTELDTVFILPPTVAPGTSEEGRAFFHDYEDLAASSTSTVVVGKTPITILAIQLQQVLQELEMTVLPSADTPAWTFTGEGAAPPAEGAVFSLGALDQLIHTVSGAPSSNSGRYSRTVADLAAPPRYQSWELSAWWRAPTVTTVNGYPWHLRVQDGEIDVEMDWDDTTIRIAGVTVGLWANLGAISNWHHMKIKRVGDLVYVMVDEKILSEVPVTGGPFGASATTEFNFGYINQAAANQDWTVWWDRVRAIGTNGRNWWNYWSVNGALSASNDWIDDATIPNPFTGTDTGKRVRIFSDNNENDGEWGATYSSATRLLLDGIERGPASVETPDPTVPAESFVVLLDPLFRPNDVGKDITISTSSLGNNGTVPVLAFISSYAVIVDATSISGTGFATEGGLIWKFSPDFVVEANVEYELIAAGGVATKTLTVRQAWPAAAQPVKVDYTTVLSAQLMRNETVANEGSGGSAGNVYYPFYLFDVSESLRNVIEEVTAAGVIPEFLRTF